MHSCPNPKASVIHSTDLTNILASHDTANAATVSGHGKLDNKTARIIVAMLATSSGACASQNALSGNAQENGEQRRTVPASVTTAQGTVLMARSFQADPLDGPLSNAMTFGSCALKSATGFLRRAAIDNAQFPGLETQPIPELSDAKSINPEQWDSHLDRIIGRKTSYGKTEFLINGEYYFPRLPLAISIADKSIEKGGQSRYFQ